MKKGCEKGTALENAIAEGAAKQSGRSLVPAVHAVMVTGSVKLCAKIGCSAIPYEKSKGDGSDQTGDRIRSDRTVRRYFYRSAGSKRRKLCRHRNVVRCRFLSEKTDFTDGKLRVSVVLSISCISWSAMIFYKGDRQGGRFI